ncbi:hypothetical protein C5708_18905 [Caulobacter sp. CCUG 60055]|uniref:hypothetical protein n=1 Tax=Caulobacter sp. CCUG 60055 TaxID=2100090 RepID=UPI001FA79A23|nr:hypothetical protein [Caulobacter sp. CCUG 60055]MCI3182316.1 hypothetical protein [Caulobacter sp. CCUG 60055]
MIHAVSEAVAARLVTLDEAVAAPDRGESRLFPAAMGEGGEGGTRFGARDIRLGARISAMGAGGRRLHGSA